MIRSTAELKDMRMAAAATVWLLGAVAAAPAQVAFTSLEPMGGQFPSSSARAVSADGAYVVGSITTTGGSRAYRWRAGQLHLISPELVDGEMLEPDGAIGVSADGSVVVGTAHPVGFRWREGVGLERIGPLPSDAINMVIRDVSEDGSVVVGYVNFPEGESRAFKWTPASGLELLECEFARTRAYGVSGDGRIILGRIWFDDRSPPVIWEGEFCRTLSFPNVSGQVGAAWAASFDGAVIVGDAHFFYNPTVARWSLPDGGFNWLGDLPGGLQAGTGYAVSRDGNVVVGTSWGPAGPAAFIWRLGDSNLTDLSGVVTGYGYQLAGGRLRGASDVSADGRVIVGYSAGPLGFGEGWVLRLDPGVECPCDFNAAEPAVNVNDLLAYLDAWFAHEVAANFDADAAIDVHDLLLFLDCWFVASAAGPC